MRVWQEFRAIPWQILVATAKGSGSPAKKCEGLEGINAVDRRLTEF